MKCQVDKTQKLKILHQMSSISIVKMHGMFGYLNSPETSGFRSGPRGSPGLLVASLHLLLPSSPSPGGLSGPAHESSQIHAGSFFLM